MEGSSNTLLCASARIQDLEYLYASNTNVSNIVSVKLSGKSNYPAWKSQMLCLLECNNMGGIVDATLVNPRSYSIKIMKQYDSLAKGWILGSVTEDVLADVHNLGSAKAVWEKLKSIFDPPIYLQEGCINSDGIYTDSTSQKSDAKTATEDIDDVSAETNTIEEDSNSIEIIVVKDIVPAETQTKNGDPETSENKMKSWEASSLLYYTEKGDWPKVEKRLKKNESLATQAISSDGSTILHIAVGTGHNDIVKNMFSYIKDEQLLQQRDCDGSTALHIAAIVGNKDAVELLVKKNSKLLQIKDWDGEKPLYKAYKNMHLDTIGYLLKAVKDDTKTELQSSVSEPDDEIGGPGDEIEVRLLVNAICAKQYSLASEWVRKLPKVASKTDDVLLAIAKTFPTALHYGETLIYPSLNKNLEIMDLIVEFFIIALQTVPETVYDTFKEEENNGMATNIYLLLVLVPTLVVQVVLIFAIIFISLLIPIVCFSFLLPYYLWWKGAKMLAVPPIKRIENKKKEWDEAIRLLELVCDEINKLEPSGTHHHHYARPILEAACQNAYPVVDMILFRSPEAIQSKDESGYDIIQLAIINRSEKIFNLIYDIGERKNLYRTYRDSFENNILHLAGKLAPSSVLNQRTGAALQLQRELQWREEVKKFVFPAYITQENIFRKTPDMVFTKEHENLVKEGEKWMKTTAESCSITAALITTIVFAAAITVPGGSNQEKGTPLFKKKTAFIIFAVSDAISLFASSTSLLVFLSILTARFEENDFLFSLPNRLFIGLFSMLLSTTAMMVAFSATLFLVFCDEKQWTLAPICGLAFIPIAFFVCLQFPLMVDLFRSTYINMFGKQRKRIFRRFNPNEIRLLFGTNIKGNNHGSSRRGSS